MMLIKLLLSYRKARRLAFDTREALESYQNERIEKHLSWLRRHSPYFAAAGSSASGEPTPLPAWPVMYKESMMHNFDSMNTAGLSLEHVMGVARAAESSRDFKATLKGYTVGLSSGTSSVRGAFVVSDAEKAEWAGAILAKLLPAGLFAGERVALFLRADSGLYQTVKTPWLSFRFFDLMGSFKDQELQLEEYKPTIIVAPAQVLRQLAADVKQGRVELKPKRVISVAEVLEKSDQDYIESVFGPVHQVYQATEGFLASTCEHGTLHLNEEYVHFEKQWLDKEKTRFVPIITDFTRTTQPIIRYRLNDVLRIKKDKCGCGRVTQALEAIEGRCEDQLILPDQTGGIIPVFSDAVSRAIACVLPGSADYRLKQTGPTSLTFIADIHEDGLTLVREGLLGFLKSMGVSTDSLTLVMSNELPPGVAGAKLRRITREGVRL